MWRYGKLFDTQQPSVIKTTVRHAIDTGNNRPVRNYYGRKTDKQNKIVTEEVKELLNNDKIEPSNSPWASPVVLVSKKDGSARFCVDYRKLNEITKKDSYPLPRIEDIFDQLVGATYYSKLDFKGGYFQVPLDEKDREKTAFSTREGLYQFKVLPQGVMNGPPTFQRIVNEILGPTRWQYCLAYIDDIIIYSKTFEEHLEHFAQICSVLHQANFRLSPSK
ncbi:unnamed protein product, partial [Didymodactylos carnosus]